MTGPNNFPIGQIVGLDKAEGHDHIAISRIAVVYVRNCPYCGSQQNQPHISKNCPGDFPQRYKELLAEIQGLKKCIEILEQEEITLFTIPVLARKFSLAERTIRDAIEAGKLPAERQGGIWLVRLSDAEDRWGSPVK